MQSSRPYVGTSAILALLISLTGCGEKQPQGQADSAGAAAPTGASSSTAPSSSGAKVTLRFDIDPIGFDTNEKMAQEYEQKTGVHLDLIKGPTDATERLSQYSQHFDAKSPDIDVYQVDVIWPGALAEHLIDLKQDFAGEVDQFFKPIIENNTVNGKLVVIPWFGDAGMLYYRTDLLKKYGVAAPPKTWDELEQVAQKIQDGERAAGNKDFWGFVWQGKAYEGLTCNAIEWQVSQGGGRVLEAGLKITVNNPQAAAAFKRAAGWVGKISPEGVTTYQEEEARQIFQQGNAAFMRNWPYAYSLGNKGDSAIKGKFDVVVLPAGSAGHAATLGGWQLGVSKYSKHPKEAVDFVKYITSRESQKRRALEMSVLPSRVDLYDDAELTSAIPFIHGMKEIFLSATPRPSTLAGDNYNQISNIYFEHVHHILTKQAPAEQALGDMEKAMQQLLK